MSDESGQELYQVIIWNYKITYNNPLSPLSMKSLPNAINVSNVK